MLIHWSSTFSGIVFVHACVPLLTTQLNTKGEILVLPKRQKPPLTSVSPGLQTSVAGNTQYTGLVCVFKGFFSLLLCDCLVLLNKCRIYCWQHDVPSPIPLQESAEEEPKKGCHRQYSAHGDFAPFRGEVSSINKIFFPNACFPWLNSNYWIICMSLWTTLE